MDGNGHMNNVKYMKYLERGRVELMVQTPWLTLTYAQKAQTLIANAEINYIKELKPFQAFSVETRINAWNDRYVFVEQLITNNGVIYTSSASRLAIIDRKTRKRVSPVQIFSQILSDPSPPAAPQSIYHFNQMIHSQRMETGSTQYTASIQTRNDSFKQEPSNERTH